MPSTKMTLNTGQRVNLYNAITGTQTGAGITLTSLYPGQHPNVDELTIQSDHTNGAKIVRFGDGNIATDGSTGVSLLAPDKHKFGDESPISLKSIWISVDTTTTIVNVIWR